MKTVGEILKKARLERKMSIEDISVRTRISIEYLEAIEKNDFQRLPPAAFTKGFIQNYAKQVRLNPTNILAIFRRDYDQDERGRIIPRGMTEPVKGRIQLFTPNTTAFVSSLAIGIIILIFFARQVMVFLSAPPLEIAEPKNNLIAASPVVVSGKTHPEAAVTVNNKPVKVENNGEFITQVNLTEGEHTIVVTATSRSGKVRSDQRLITIQEVE